jgi:hypothetical protein
MSPPDTPFSVWLTLLRENPYAAARDAASTGTRVVGYVGDGVPVSLILAAGALPVRLRGSPGSTHARADAFIESSFSAELAIIAEQWMAGALDFLDAVVFARSDDSGQRLYYYLSELQRRGLFHGPRPLLFDVATLPREASLEHTKKSVRLLAGELHTSVGELDRSLQRVAQRDALLRDLQARRLQPSPLPGSTAWLLHFAAACDWRENFEPRARQWLEQAQVLAAPRRILLAGSPPPDDRVHLAVEKCGGSVVLELTESAVEGEPHGRDAFAVLAGQSQRRESPALSMRRDARWLADLARAQRIDAVILWLCEHDEALPWEVVRQRQSLREAGVPALLLARQPWQISADALTQVTDFLRTPGMTE